MKVMTKGKLLLSTAVLGTVLYMPIDHSKVEAATPSEKKLQRNHVLHFGASGNRVFELQSYLKAFNYYNGDIDGLFGLLTKQAVSSYQSNHLLQVDGIAGPETIGHLLHAATVELDPLSTKTTIHVDSNHPEDALTTGEITDHLKGESIKVFRPGDRGERVKQLQETLAEHGYYEGIDGIYGPRTAEAVKQFQHIHHLQVDGMIGPETKKMLANQQAVKSAPVAATSIKQSDTQVTGQSKQQADLTSTAVSLKGVPYSWGGTSPSGFDCSGFIQYVFSKHGKSLPRTTKELFQNGQSISQLQTGDLVFFSTYRSGPSHAGIYLGNRQFIHAGSSTGVTISSLDHSYWSQRYLGGRRL